MISITASILTVTIAAIVAFIAWLQWRTADEKVVLHLFDKRFAVYEELRNGIYPARSGDQNAVLGFKVATYGHSSYLELKSRPFLKRQRVTSRRPWSSRSLRLCLPRNTLRPHWRERID
jgi:hypothetical protein